MLRSSIVRSRARGVASTLLLSGLFFVAMGGVGCQLSTDGQSGPELDASSAPSSSSSVCNLTCARGSHCELDAQGPVCAVNSTPESDAGTSTAPPTTSPPGACNLACKQGSHCTVGAQGPACVPDTQPPVVTEDAGTPTKERDAGAPPTETCSLACGTGHHCQLTPKGPHCVVDEKAVDAGTETACGSETCAADEKCCSASCGICEPRGGACPAIACPVVDAEVPKQTCANTKCPARTYCDDITGTAECKQLPSCDTVKCTATTTCELVQVQCVRAPCPPLPMCVPKETQVCNLACKVGTHCAILGNGPKCEADDQNVSCGKKTCSAGQICCNAGCGICGSPNGACPAIACVPSDGTV
jgi:hypothetical protein